MFTASSFVGDASQLTNLPASGGTLEATASGTLADGSKVVINTDGTVSVVAQSETTGPGTGPATVFESASVYDISATYDSTNQKVVIAYRDVGNSDYGTAVVGTVSGTSISFGSPVVFNSANSRFNKITYDASNNKVVIAYSDYGNNYYGTAIVGTVSGTSISFGSSAVFNSTGQTEVYGAVYDSTNQKVVIGYRDYGNSFYGTAVVGTVSGTSISFGSPVVFNSSDLAQIILTYDSANGKVVIAYDDIGNSRAATAIVGTVSGTSISFGSESVYNSTEVSSQSATYDSTNGKVVIAFRDEDNSQYGKAIVGTVSGTSISFGSPVTFESSSVYDISATYDSTNDKVVIAYRDNGNSGAGTVIVGTVSGTSISFGSPFVFDSNIYSISVIFDSANSKVVIAYQDAGNSYYGTGVVFGSSGFSIPQVGSPEVFEPSATTDTSAAFDSTNNKVVIFYDGKASVGTVSGTSINFGSPVSSGLPSVYLDSLIYDSTNQKVVIAYTDSSNNYYGTAIVGTVSGTSISFGSPAVFESANSFVISAAYDSTNQKVVISYADNGNSNYGTVVVGTVSGTSISFGTPVVFSSGYCPSTATAFDSSNGKVVIVYPDGNNSYYGSVKVGTVSGTSISLGTAAVFESASIQYPSATFDSTNNKVIIAYGDSGNSNYGTGIVGTVSGTSISFGTPAVFESGEGYRYSAVYDSTNQKVVIAYRDYDDSSLGKVVVGTVSGTSISFGSPIVFHSGYTSYTAAAYDSSNDKAVIAYKDGGNSDYGTAVVFSPVTMTTINTTNLTAENFIGISDASYTNGQTATIQISGSIDDAQSGLTPGQKYYVQGDGTLSETADSPSVLAGTAVASTKLIING
jgi:hypothetical protein